MPTPATDDTPPFERQPHSWYVGALNAFTTNAIEAEKMTKLYPVTTLYPEAAFAEVDAKFDEFVGVMEQLVARNDRLIANERRLLDIIDAQNKRIEKIQKSFEREIDQQQVLHDIESAKK